MTHSVQPLCSGGTWQTAAICSRRCTDCRAGIGSACHGRQPASQAGQRADGDGVHTRACARQQPASKAGPACARTRRQSGCWAGAVAGAAASARVCLQPGHWAGASGARARQRRPSYRAGTSGAHARQYGKSRSRRQLQPGRTAGAANARCGRRACHRPRITRRPAIATGTCSTHPRRTAVGLRCQPRPRLAARQELL